MTHFAAQSTRFADLYSSSCINLLYYPDSHLFTAPHQLVGCPLSSPHYVISPLVPPPPPPPPFLSSYFDFFQMPHETFVEQNVEAYSRSGALSPMLNAKLDAKSIAQKKKSPLQVDVRMQNCIYYCMYECANCFT